MRTSIRERARGGVRGLALAISAAVVLAIPSPAAAAFHLTKVSEVYAGTGIAGTDDYIELQAFESGQNLVGGHEITVYDDNGVLVHTFAFPGDAPNAQTQRTILVGAGPLANGVDPDFIDPALDLGPRKNGGAVCFESQPVDCVAWGDFAGPSSLPGAVGNPVSPTGLPNGSSITRSIASGCSTLLEASDDTDDSAADFAVTTNRTPRPNTEAPTERACGGRGDAPDTKIDKGPKKRTSKTSAKFRFSSSDEGADFECSLDGTRFKQCSSPLKVKRLKKGRHTFEVRAATDGAKDGSPASYRWRVVGKK